MQAIILAAGKSTRTYPLTETKPKALIKIANKPILKYNIENLKGLVDEIILIVGFKKEMIKEHFRENCNGVKITYVEQKEQLGTAHALQQAENLIKDRFIVMMGDDIYYRKGIEKCLKHRYSILVQKVKNPERFGVCVIENGLLKGFEEKPEKFISDMVNCALYTFDKKIFQLIKNLKKSKRGEYELTDAVLELTESEDVAAVDAEKGWLSVGYPWDILNANERLLEEIKKDVKGDVEENAVIKGNVVIGKGTLVRSGSYIEGPVSIGENCKIGPNCYIRPSTSIGNNCKIGNAVEIKNTVIGDSVSVGHLSYIGDSVLGNNINIGAGTITANLRHDKGNIKMFVKEKAIDTDRNKLGVVIGDNAKLGINTSIYPGRKIWANKHTIPNEVIEKDKI